MENLRIDFTKEEREELEKLASEYRAFQLMEKQSAEQKNKIGERIKEVMRDRVRADLSEFTIDYKEVCKTVFDSKSLKKDIPELYEKYAGTQVTRPLYVR